MISVIVPVYNAAAYLTKCIESILHQTYSDFELILINDGSTDESDSICRKFAANDSRVVYVSKPNSGVGATRNVGLSIAKGDWICFVDSDDVVKPYYLESFNVNTTSAELVISGLEFYDIRAKNILRTIEFKDVLYEDSQFRSSIKDFLLIGFPYGKAYQKKILDTYQLRFPEDISFHEDHVFVLDYYSNISSIETSSGIGYIYNIDYLADSLSKKKHPWKLLNKSSDYMLNRIEIIKQKFHIPTNELTIVYNFCFEPKISAIYSLYDSKEDANHKQSHLREILYGEYSVRRYYKPTNTRGELIKVLSTLLPLPLLHLFFKFVNRYQHRNR